MGALYLCLTLSARRERGDPPVRSERKARSAPLVCTSRCANWRQAAVQAPQLAFSCHVL